MATSSSDSDRSLPARVDVSRRARAREWASAGLWLFVGALVIRLAITLPFIQYPIALDDMLQYDMLARSLIDGNGYRWYSQADLDANKAYLQQVLDYSVIRVPPDGVRTTFRPPGYPFFLAGLYLFFPHSLRWALTRIVQCGLGALLALLAAWLGLSMGLGRRVAWLAGIGVAVYPILLMYPIALASENLFIPLVGLSIILVLWSTGRSPVRRAGIAGAVLGLAMLTRSVISPFALIAALWIGRFSPARWRGAVVFLAAAFGVCLPWMVRNSLISGRPVFVETSLSYQMYIGYHPEGDGGFATHIAVRPLSIVDDAERDRYCREAVIGFINADPLDAVGRVVKRAVYFFGAEDRELIYFYTNNFFGSIPPPWSVLLYLGLVIPWVSLCVLAVMGALVNIRRAATWLLLGFVVGYVAPHLMIIAEPRFHLVLVPVLAPLAALGWAGRSEAVRRIIWPGMRLNLVRWSGLVVLICLLGLWVWGFWMRWGHLVAVLSPGGNTLRQVY